jgi:hypothetical protein
MRTPPPKTSTPRRAALAKGGETPMFGRGDRTVTAPADAAGEQTPAITGQKSKSNRKFAEGGSPHGMAPNRPATPAKAGQTAPAGGEARPAKAGRCAP